MNGFWAKYRAMLEVWFVAAGILGGLALYDYSGAPVAIDIELKQTGIRSFFEGDTLAAESLLKRAQAWAALDSVALDSALQSTMKATAQDNMRVDSLSVDGFSPRVRTDSSAHHILLTGDSMCEELMFAFKKYAKHNGHSLKTRIWYSSSTKQWAKEERLESYIRAHRPSFILFTLGSNELFIRNIKAREKYIQSIVSTADRYGIPFVWIGPPNWKKDTGINRLIEQSVGTDRYFESEHLTFARKSDGAHPTRGASAIWADTISTWLAHTSRYRGQILMRDPKAGEPLQIASVQEAPRAVVEQAAVAPPVPAQPKEKDSTEISAQAMTHRVSFRDAVARQDSSRSPQDSLTQ